MIILKGGKILIDGKLAARDILIDGKQIIDIDCGIDATDAQVYNCCGCWITSGAIDVHTHLREPGYEHKETIATGTRSAAKGGITAIMSMPNLIPCPDSIANMAVQQRAIDSSAVVKVYPYAALTVGEQGKRLSDIRALAGLVKGFSDDGHCVKDLRLLQEGMLLAKELGFVIASHAEAEGCSGTESESVAVLRETELAIKTGCKYHFCHLSAQKSFEIIRKAKAAGADITCEVMPHHLFLNQDDIKGDTNAKMSPPLRSEYDRQAALSALLDGTIDIIATDHAPHTPAEKAVPFELAPNGIIGLETLMPLVYTGLVKTGLATYADMQKWVAGNPAARFGIPYSDIAIGGTADIAVLDTDTATVYNKQYTLSKSSNTPFNASRLYGTNVLTLVDGKVVYDNNRRMQ